MTSHQLFNEKREASLRGDEGSIFLLPGYFVESYKALFVKCLRTYEQCYMVAVPTNHAIFYYVMIEVGCSDNPGVHIKGVRISEGATFAFK